ncbi:MAG: hypothetical protein ABSD85_05735 [Acidimicrobiales bacterium]|jgi:hypothetical protein
MRLTRGANLGHIIGIDVGSSTTRATAAEPILPDPGAVAVCEEAYRRYLALFDAVEVALP